MSEGGGIGARRIWAPRVQFFRGLTCVPSKVHHAFDHDRGQKSAISGRRLQWNSLIFSSE